MLEVYSRILRVQKVGGSDGLSPQGQNVIKAHAAQMARSLLSGYHL